MSDERDWEFTPRADEEFANLDAAVQRQLLNKLDDVVTDKFREPPDYLSQLTSLPYRSLCLGDYRAIIDVDRDATLLSVMSVGHRSSVYGDFPWAGAHRRVVGLSFPRREPRGAACSAFGGGTAKSGVGSLAELPVCGVSMGLF